MRQARLTIRRTIAVITSVAMLSGCAPTLGMDDGTDPCRPQLEALNATSNFFAQNIIAGAAVGAVAGAGLSALVTAALGGGTRDIGRAALIGGVGGGIAGGVSGYFNERQRQARNDAMLLQNAVASDLAKENQEIDRTRLAFNQLMGCRFTQRNQILVAYRARRVTAPQANAELAVLRNRVENDIAIAQRINQNVGRRGAEFDVAIDNVAPDVRAHTAVRQPRQVTTYQPVALRVAPADNAPEVAQVAARQAVTVTPAEGNFALIQTADGMRGYAPASQVGTRGLGNQAPAVARGGEVRQLAATNIASRESFNESIETARSLARAPSGFEVAL